MTELAGSLPADWDTEKLDHNFAIGARSMGKGRGSRGRGWLLQLGVAAGYTLAYLAIRPFSDPHWALTSGLRLACLLLIPYRYWFALAVGEAVPLTYSLFQCVDQFGLAWAVVGSIPPIAVAMPIVWYCRRHLGLFPALRIVDVKALLIAVLAVSLTWALVSYGAILLATVPKDDPVPITAMMLVAMFVGNYVAILSVVTWPLLLKIAHRDDPFKTRIQAAVRAPLTTDSCFILLPVLLLLAWISTKVGASNKEIVYMAMFLPAAWLTLKYGWRGTAVSGPITVACVCILTPGDAPDPVIIQSQAFIAFVVTCLFLMGARIAAQLHVEEREKQAVRNALRVAQECLNEGELRLRQTAHALELVGGAMSLTEDRVFARVQHFLSHDEQQQFAKQVMTTRNRIYRLAETLHPSAWRERGLPAALRESIGRALDEAGIPYRCNIAGRGLSQLAPTVHQAIYRLAAEAVTQVCHQQTCHLVTLTLRGGLTQGRRWAVLRVAGTRGHLDPLSLAHSSGDRHHIHAKLGTQGMSESSLRARVALFDGTVHIKRSDGMLAITLLLHDAQHLSAGQALDIPGSKDYPASNLWVR